jgi:hypothetical protein
VQIATIVREHERRQGRSIEHEPMGVNSRGDAQCSEGCGDWPCQTDAKRGSS